jgi:hypothetical protein
MAETIVVMLAAGETFISSEGRIYKKGEHYELPSEQAIKLMMAMDDYGVRFFKKSTQTPTQGQAAKVSDKSVLPTTEEIATDMGTPTSGEEVATQGEIATPGEIDTSEQQRGRGRPSRQVQV